MSGNYYEETKPLFKLLRTEAFRFVIVRFNHYSLLRQLEVDLRTRFPDRPLLKIDARTADYRSIADAYFSMQRGFFFLENFDDVLKEERDSLNREPPEMAANNERRRQITAGLNLRRDKLAKLPIALFAFVPATANELYAKTIMEKMPDLWSFLSLMLDLEKEIPAPVFNMENIRTGSDVAILQTDDTELQRLLSRLKKTPEDEVAYRLTLYPQIVRIAKDTGKYELALSMLDAWEQQTAPSEYVWIWIQKGDILKTIGKSEDALAFYEKAQALAAQNGEKNNLALCYERLGDTYEQLGNVNEALRLFEQYNQLEKELHASFPDNVSFKNGLAISYEKLGQTHSDLGDYATALRFLEQSLAIQQQIGDRQGEGRTLNNLATTAHAQGDYATALRYLEQSLAIQQQIGDRQGEGATLNNISQIYDAQGDYATALRYLEQSLAIRQQIGDRQGEGRTLNNLATTAHAQGDYATALRYLEQSLAIRQQIGDIAGMATTMHNIGAICFKRERYEEAIPFFIQAFQIFQKIGSPDVRVAMSYLSAIIGRIGGAKFEEILAKMNRQ